MPSDLLEQLKRDPGAVTRMFASPSRTQEAAALVSALDQIAAAIPPAAVRALLMALKAYLIDHPPAFHAAYAELHDGGARAPGPERGRFAPEAESRIEAVVGEMREKGVAVWRGMFAAEVEAMRESTIEPLGRAKRYLKSGTVAADGAPKVDESMGCEYWGKPASHDYGRYRAFFRNGRAGIPGPIRAHLEDVRAHEVGRRYYRAPVANGGVLMEFLEPGLAAGDFHVDKIMDQFKIMVLLEDVREENGAMRVKPGTHRLWRAELKPMWHNIFSYGNEWCGVSEPAWQVLPQKTAYVTGQAGDAWFFDTMGLHTATPCLEGYRLAAVSYYSVMTRKNAILPAFGVR